MILSIGVEDSDCSDVRVLANAQLEFCRSISPIGDVHALGPSELNSSAITIFGARRDNVVLGIGVLNMLSIDQVEIKCMHTRADARGSGVGRAMLEHLLNVARERGCRSIALETGTMEAFAPARALYESVGFTACEPFGDYVESPASLCMSLEFSSESER